MFGEFKKLMFSWLQMNKFFTHKSIFKSLKDTAVCIGHLANISPFWISRTQYQEHINLLLEATVQEKVEKDAKYYKLFNTAVGHAKFDIQLYLGKQNVCYEGKQIKTDALSVYVRLILQSRR
eukprot:8577532-Ditylum_brightwellii.AAC.1